MELGLVTSSSYLRSEESTLLRLLRRYEGDIRQLHVGLHVVGRAYSAIVSHGVMANYEGLHQYSNDRYSGLVGVAAAIVDTGPDALDGLVYLASPDDASALLPEAVTLKRQCLIHSKPYLSTMASFVDWIETERLLMGHPCRPGTASPDDTASTQTLALIAHDGMKQAMLSFVGEYFDLLSRFARRVSTASTGHRLNALARERGWPPDIPWTSCCRSGPLGGDAQIARLVLTHQCQRVLFFRDPLVPHAHEADISMLERAIAANTEDTVYIASPAMAIRWAEAAHRCIGERREISSAR
jgi:methylglyoxal synthase